MDRLVELRTLRRMEMKYYYQKVLPNVTRIKIFTIVSIVFYTITALFNLNFILATVIFGFQLLVGVGWLLAVVTFLVYRVQLTIIQDRIDTIRKDCNKDITPPQ